MLEHPRLDWHLDNWVRYMRAPDTRGLGVVTCRYWHSGSSDFDTLADTAEMQCARTMDAVISDLPPVQRTCVHHVHLGVRFVYPDSVETVYADARASMSRGMALRDVV